jgi:transcriptional regulator of aromatic amino acid metabolism
VKTSCFLADIAPTSKPSMTSDAQPVWSLTATPRTLLRRLGSYKRVRKTNCNDSIFKAFKVSMAAVVREARRMASVGCAADRGERAGTGKELLACLADRSQSPL